MQLDDAAAAYDELSAGGRVAVVGDSAGGTLALLLASRLRDSRAAAPAASGLVTPLAHLTLAVGAAYQGAALPQRRRGAAGVRSLPRLG